MEMWVEKYSSFKKITVIKINITAIASFSFNIDRLYNNLKHLTYVGHVVDVALRLILDFKILLKPVININIREFVIVLFISSNTVHAVLRLILDYKILNK